MIISLNEWSKRNNINYGTCHRYFEKGMLIGAYRDSSNHILIPEDCMVELGKLIKCKICDKEVSKITASHLKVHNMTFKEYKDNFPDAPRISEEVSKILSEQSSERMKDPENKNRLASLIKDKDPWNKGTIGLVVMTQEVLDKREETKKRNRDNQNKT